MLPAFPAFRACIGFPDRAKAREFRFGSEHVQGSLIERKRGNSVLDKAVFTDLASGYGEENQRTPERNLPLEAD